MMKDDIRAARLLLDEITCRLQLLRLEAKARAIENFLGGAGRIVPTDDGDFIVINDLEDRKIRFDINDPGKN